MGYDASFRVWRGDDEGGGLQDFTVEVNEGEVVLDIIHRLQATQAPDLAVRWNCKAGKCGSCSAEVNGMPKLQCMARLNELNLNEPVTIEPMKTFPLIRDLVTDVSWNYAVKQKIKKYKPRKPEADGTWRMDQEDVDRVQEFRKCIECYLCQDVCHVLREHQMFDAFAMLFRDDRSHVRLNFTVGWANFYLTRGIDERRQNFFRCIADYNGCGAGHATFAGAAESRFDNAAR